MSNYGAKIKRCRSAHADSFASRQQHEFFKNEKVIFPNAFLKKKHAATDNDDLSFNDHTFHEHGDYSICAHRDSITNSEIDRLEADIVKNLSVKFRENQGSVTSIDSVIEVLKANVQNIFNNFDENMHDIEVFKRKFNDIVQRYKGDTLNEMEQLIHTMLEHMSSSEFKDKNAPLQSCKENYNLKNESNFKSFNNLNFTTVTTPDGEESFQVKTDSCNTLILNTSVEKALSGRTLLSEINIRKKIVDALNTLASSENIQKLAEKKMEIDNYCQDVEHPHKDIDIPIKSSSAKKDLYLNVDFEPTKSDETFFIFKICSYICKKIKRNPFA